MKEPKIFKDCCPGLRTEWETPHQCKNCMCHISDDWSFCPECGNALYEQEEIPKLKPCPFCGETEMDLMEDTPEGCITEYFVSCSCCGAQVANEESMKDAIALWNRRV